MATVSRYLTSAIRQDALALGGSVATCTMESYMWHTHRREPPVFFWRDQTGHEVDLLIDDAEGLFPVEIKSGATVAAAMFEGLRWWNTLTGTPFSHSTLVHGGADRYERSGIRVRPWFSV